MYHLFDVNVACQVGVVAAILFQNIAYWCQHSQANGTNYHDGMFWTYNTVKAFKAIFPYLSSKQIDTSIKKLVDAGLIVKGNYNKSSYDRTTWYAITENGKSIFQKGKMEIPETENGFPENGKPIPDINTVVGTDVNTNESRRKRFTPPTADEVRAYAKEKGFSIDAERFVNFYESKGWKVGSSPMKDWRASVRNWASRERDISSPTSAPTVYTDPDYENYW